MRRSSPSQNSLDSEKGSLTPLFLLLTVVVSTSLVGVLSLSKVWTHLTAHQFRLDRCVEKVSKEFQTSIERIEFLNTVVGGLRTAIALAALQPELLSALQAQLRTTHLTQKGILGYWKVRQIQWFAQRGCGQGKDFALPLPDLPFKESPPDVLGPRPFIRSSENVFYISAGHALFYLHSIGLRHSTAEIRRDHEHWKRKWTSTARMSGARSP